MPRPRLHSTDRVENQKPDEIFGESRRFVPSTVTGPHFRGYIKSRTWENKILNYEPKEWAAIGNIHAIYHGTSREKIKFIAIQSLLPMGGKKFRKTNKFAGGLFGPGIYTTPKAIKAWGHSPNWYDKETKIHKKYLLEGRVALGKVFEPRTSGDQRSRMVAFNCNSVAAKAGIEITGLWGGKTTLAIAEYVVYDPIQVVIDYVFEYEEIPTKKTYVSVYYPVRGKGDELHPCHKNGKLCKNAYNISGCIIKNKKKGITKEDFEFCRSYE